MCKFINENDINEVTLTGTLIADAEMVEPKNGSPFAKVVIGSNKTWTAPDEEKKTHSDYYTIYFNRTDVKMAAKLIKGDKIHVKGVLRNRKSKDSEGVVHYATNIVAKELLILTWTPRQKKEASKKAYRKNV